MTSLLKMAFTVLISGLLGWALASGVPLHFFAGFFFLCIILFLFFKNPLWFLCSLFLLRSALDPLLRSMRFHLGIELGFGGAVSLLIIALTLMSIVTSDRILAVKKQIIVGLYLLFCLVILSACFFTADKAVALKILIRQFSILSVLVLTILNVRNEKDASLLIGAMLLSPVFSLIVGFFMGSFIKGGTRFSGSVGHPNVLAYYLIIMIGCLMVRLDQGIKYLRSTFARYGLMVILLVGLIATRTRSGWGACAIMFIMYVAMFRRKLLIPAVVLLIAVSFSPIIQERITNTVEIQNGSIAVRESSSLGWRFEKWHYLWDIALQKPFTGHGLESSTEYGQDRLGAHNDYLRYLVETGFPGLITYFLPYLFVLFHAIGARKKMSGKNEYLFKLASFFNIFIPSFLIMSITENLASYIVIHWYLWALIGIYFSLYFNYSSASGPYQRSLLGAQI